MRPSQEMFRAGPRGFPHILLMEDEPSVAQGLQMTLREEGYQVDWAETGQSALDNFRRRQFDLLVADLRLPDMDGMEVIKQIKEQQPDTGVLVITGYATVPTAVEAMKLGACDYLAKPFTAEELKAAVEGFLKEQGGPGVEKPTETQRVAQGSAVVAEGRDASANGGQMRARILLVEDEPSVAQGLQIALGEEGYGVDWATTGQAAVDKVRDNGFDLLVVDIRLPDMDGIEVIRRVKETRPAIEVVVITGYATIPSAVQAMKLGAYDYLQKPFTEREFRTTVQGALRRMEEGTARELLDFFDTQEGRLIQKAEVIRVLNRTAGNYAFGRELMEQGSKALEGYKLSVDAKGAIVSGDLRWIRKHVGELTGEQLRFMQRRLQREAW